jgi:hypothetical protein
MALAYREECWSSGRCRSADARMFNRYATGFDPVHGSYADNTNVAHVVFWAMDP